MIKEKESFHYITNKYPVTERKVQLVGFRAYTNPNSVCVKNFNQVKNKAQSIICLKQFKV